MCAADILRPFFAEFLIQTETFLSRPVEICIVRVTALKANLDECVTQWMQVILS